MLTIETSLAGPALGQPADLDAFVMNAANRLREVAGISAAAAAYSLPTDQGAVSPFVMNDRGLFATGAHHGSTRWEIVTPEYFATWALRGWRDGCSPHRTFGEPRPSPSSTGPWRAGIGVIAVWWGSASPSGVQSCPVIACAPSLELSIRNALGASRRQLLRLVLGQGAAIVASGIVVGVVGAMLMGAALESYLFGVKALAPLRLAAITLAQALAAAAAILVAALPAAQTDPRRVID